jgi:hypothetical protein
MPVSPALNSQVLASALAVMDVAPVSARLTLHGSRLFHVDHRSNGLAEWRAWLRYFDPKISL